MISVDRGVLVEGSAVRARMEHFGSLADGIDIVTLRADLSTPLKLKNNVTVYGVSGRSKMGAALKALRLIKQLVGQHTIIATQDPFKLGAIGLLVSWRTDRPLHVQVHIDFFSPYFRQESLRQRFQTLLAPFVLARAASLKVVSANIATFIRCV